MEAKISVDVPGQVTGQALDFCQRLLGPAAEAADFLSEKIRYYRWRAAAQVIAEATEMAAELGIETTQVPIKFLVPFLEQCSLEDETSGLTRKWAGLLTSAATNYQQNHRLFIDILSKINPETAIFSHELYLKTDSGNRGGHTFLFKTIAETQSLLSAMLKQAETGGTQNTAHSYIEIIQDIKEKFLKWGALPIYYELKHEGQSQLGFTEDYRTHRDAITTACSLGIGRVEEASSQHIDPITGKLTTRIWFFLLSDLGFSFIEACEGPSTQGRNTAAKST